MKFEFSFSLTFVHFFFFGPHIAQTLPLRVQSLHSTTLSKMNSPVEDCALALIVKLSRGHFWNAFVLLERILQMRTVNLISCKLSWQQSDKLKQSRCKPTSSPNICLQNLDVRIFKLYNSLLQHTPNLHLTKCSSC